MTLPGYRVEFYNHPTERQKKVFAEFLDRYNLEYENTVDMSLKVLDEATDEMVGTGSIEGKVIKCMAIDPKRRGEGLSAFILSELVKALHSLGRNHIFVFTNPKNIEETSGNVFAGFKIVSKTDEIVLLEMGSTLITDYLDDLKFKTRGIKENYSAPFGAIVVNCNPYTLGHQYLIETASKECSFVYVFVVSEDKSVFPTDVRVKLVKEGTKHLDNVLVIEGGEYIISPATFPRYFLKECDDVSLAQARLDITIFADHIVSLLGITRRYVGEEPYCMVTKSYNQAMVEILLPKGVELKIIPRRMKNGDAISASKVRELLHERRIDDTIDYIPPSTYNFLKSKEGKMIIEKIVKGNSRH
ncbi:MAG: [citrate (pro-3S)-lyase] ligase [Asgard group archaeon]|nr:[citrate (pro-3S)-lyase] ligase [Asgard group archaeon]